MHKLGCPESVARSDLSEGRMKGTVSRQHAIILKAVQILWIGLGRKFPRPVVTGGLITYDTVTDQEKAQEGRLIYF